MARRPTTSGRDARRGSLLLAILLIIIMATDVWQTLELQNVLRRDVLQTNRAVADAVATILSSNSETSSIPDRITRALRDLPRRQEESIHVYDEFGNSLSSTEVDRWAGSSIVEQGLAGNSGQGSFAPEGSQDERLTAFVPIPGDRGVVIVDRPRSAARPGILGVGAVRFIVSSSVLVFCAILLGRQLQQTIRSRNESEAILTSLAEGVLIVDTDASIVTMNPAMERLSGWTQEEAQGRVFTEVLELLDEHDNPIPYERRPIVRALQRRWVVTSRGFELTLVVRGGRRMPVNLATAPIFGPTGTLLGAVAIVRDISYEHEIDQMKTALISTVSHELRTPLTLIKGYAELMLNRSFDETGTRESIKHIQASAERLSRLIEDLLSVSRIEAGQVQMRTATIELPEVIREVVESWGTPRGRAFEIDLDPACTYVLADRDRLIQVLTNLVSNAVKYSPPDAPITITARLQQQYAEIGVTDLGIGLSDDDKNQLFGKFFRSGRDEVRLVGGTGLGLYIARNLVEMQGGTIRVESQLGGGSTFYFTLPCVVENRSVLDRNGREVS